jgi:hypothetical protein
VKTFKCRGTLGDSYIVNCVIYAIANKEDVLIKQCYDYSGNAVDDWRPHIEEIYSLVPNIHVSFVGKNEFESLDVPRLWPTIPKALEENICPLTPHPTFSFPYVAKTLVDSYIAMSPRGGKSDERHRHCDEEEMRGIIDTHPNRHFVMVGDNPEFKEWRLPNLTNLIGTTTVLEAMGVVARAKAFIGVQGLAAYVATSNKVPSVVYTKSSGYDKAFRNRMMKEWLPHCLVYKTRRSEDSRAFQDFMRGESYGS